MVERRIWATEQDAKIIKMRWENKTWAEIAKELNASRNTVIERGRRINAIAPTKLQLQEMQQKQEEPKISKSYNREPLPAGHPVFWKMLCPNDDYPINQ